MVVESASSPAEDQQQYYKHESVNNASGRIHPAGGMWSDWGKCQLYIAQLLTAVLTYPEVRRER